MLMVYGPQHLAHTRFLQAAAAKGNGLIGQRQGISHGAPGCTPQQAQRGGIKFDALGPQHLGQVGLHGLGRHGAQVELQTARQNRDRHFLRVGGRQHELQVVGWLFQRLEHRIEGRGRQHVHFIDHVDLEAARHRLVDRLLQQLGNLVHTAVRCRVQFNVVDEPSCINVATGLALPAGLGSDAALAIRPHTVQRFGQDARDRGLAHATGSGEQIGMVQTPLQQGIAQRLDNMFLAHHGIKTMGPVLASENGGHHCLILGVEQARESMARIDS